MQGYATKGTSVAERVSIAQKKGEEQVQEECMLG